MGKTYPEAGKQTLLSPLGLVGKAINAVLPLRDGVVAGQLEQVLPPPVYISFFPGRESPRILDIPPTTTPPQSAVCSLRSAKVSGAAVAPEADRRVPREGSDEREVGVPRHVPSVVAVPG